MQLLSTWTVWKQCSGSLIRRKWVGLRYNGYYVFCLDETGILFFNICNSFRVDSVRTLKFEAYLFLPLKCLETIFRYHILKISHNASLTNMNFRSPTKDFNQHISFLILDTFKTSKCALNFERSSV